MIKGFFIFVLALIVLCPEFTQAQSFFAARRERSMILTVGTGSSTYYGELSNPGTLIKYQPNVNLGLQFYIAPKISVRGELNWFILQGTDTQANDNSRKKRNLSFQSSCFELSATGAISLYANGNRYYRRPAINVYGFAGIGLLYFNPTATYQGKSYALQPLHTEGVSYGKFVPVIPMGLGVRLKTGPNTNIVVEGGYRKTFTDYLDDVSSKYTAPSSNPVTAYFQNPSNPTYNPGATGNTNTYKAGDQRGDPSKTDSYFLLNVKLEYYLPYAAAGKRSSGLIGGGKRKSTYRYNKSGGIKRRK